MGIGASVREMGSEQATTWIGAPTSEPSRVGNPVEAVARQERVSDPQSLADRISGASGVRRDLLVPAQPIREISKRIEISIRLLDVGGSLAILVVSLPVT